MSDNPPVLPQLPTQSNAVVLSVEWMFEPCWRGDRLMARVHEGRVSLSDAEGKPADRGFAEVAEVLEPALTTDDAVLDGIWTNMPFVGEGSAARHLAEAIAEEGLDGELPDPIENEPRRAFVALDLVEVEEQPLYDVPYLERRRLLASVIDEGVRVRLTPAVRVPLHNWLGAWRANGFSHYLAKHVNSRYHPGEVAEDWLQLSTAAERGPNPVARLFGARPRKRPHIEDGVPGDASKSGG